MDFKKSLERRFGLWPVLLADLEREVRFEKKRLAKYYGLALAVTALVAAAGFFVGEVRSFLDLIVGILIVVAFLIVAAFCGARESLSLYTELVPAEDLPGWLITLEEGNQNLHKELLRLLKEQRGVYRWQYGLLKQWPLDQRRMRLRDEASLLSFAGGAK